ncbi:succinate dehydrogenase, subunit D isoform X1 [Anticarsia gemmatalis]|uniref:succinate dehydrogenase, subunit D isoform X1 n=1 Tax=Anticarsia gemmatalis TaxID=129554 RepID=UPI003F773BAA
MALSMFLRTPVCTSSVFRQQVMRLATQPALLKRPIASATPLRLLAAQQPKTTPILNAVRSFRTSIVRLSQEKGHDHSKLWIVEKAVAAIMIPLMPIALLMPNKLFDSVLAILISAHTFWGLEAIVVEYLRVLVVGPVVPKVAMTVVYVLTVNLLGGLFYLIFNDIGLCRGYWRIWRNMRGTKRAKK